MDDVTDDLTEDEQTEAGLAEAARKEVLATKRFRGALQYKGYRGRRAPISQEVESLEDWLRRGGNVTRCPPGIAQGAVSAVGSAVRVPPQDGRRAPALGSSQ